LKSEFQAEVASLRAVHKEHVASEIAGAKAVLVKEHEALVARLDETYEVKLTAVATKFAHARESTITPKKIPSKKKSAQRAELSDEDSEDEDEEAASVAAARRRSRLLLKNSYEDSDHEDSDHGSAAGGRQSPSRQLVSKHQPGEVLNYHRHLRSRMHGRPSKVSPMRATPLRADVKLGMLRLAEESSPLSF
jgi:hypothetical protein